MSGKTLSVEDAHEFLVGCSKVQLIELFCSAAARYRETYSEDHPREFVDGALVVCRGTLRDDGDTALIAIPNRASDAYVSDELTQNGYCQTCQLEEIGFSKSSICPICLNPVDMT